MGSFSLWHWLVVLLIVVLIFGTKRLRNMGGDLGAALKDFRKGLQGDEASNAQFKADAPDPMKAPSDARRDDVKRD